MNKLLSRLVILLVGVAAGVLAGLLLPTEQREQLSRQLAASIGGMVEHCPDG
jgi:hypothetical protein